MSENKWYVFRTDNYGSTGFESYDTIEELKKYLSEDYSDDDLYTIVYGKEYKYELNVKVIETKESE